MANKVFLLEDDKSICELVKCTLDLSSISCEYFTTVKEFREAMERETPDVVLLDIMLTDGDGVEVLKEVKTHHPEVSAIMLSALSKETDKVRGLNAGADDYIAKPFGVLELVARVNAALRRTAKSSVLKVGELEMNFDNMTVVYRGKPLTLNNKEFQLLKFCAANEGKVLPRDTLLTEVWGYDDGETRTLDNHIARLRKLGLNFETVFGVGYRFIAGRGGRNEETHPLDGSADQCDRAPRLFFDLRRALLQEQPPLHRKRSEGVYGTLRRVAFKRGAYRRIRPLPFRRALRRARHLPR